MLLRYIALVYVIKISCFPLNELVILDFWKFSKNHLVDLQVARRLMYFIVCFGVLMRNRLTMQVAQPNFWVSLWTTWRWWTPARRRADVTQLWGFQGFRLFFIDGKGVLIIDWLKGKGLWWNCSVMWRNLMKMIDMYIRVWTFGVLRLGVNYVGKNNVILCVEGLTYD